VTMDIEGLLRPLAGASACGEDLMFSPVFDEIQEARRFDDPSLSQGEWVTDFKEADWAGVVRRCSELLATRSKDLRLAAWLTEALARTRGVAGLGDGYRFVAALCAAHWPDLHPRSEDGDQEARIGTLDWLLSQSHRLIRELPLTDSPKGRFSFDDLEAARNLAQAVERNPQEGETRLRGARVTLAQIEAAREDTPHTFFTENLAAARTAQMSLAQLQGVVDGHVGAQGPAFGAARGALESLVETLGRFAGRSCEADAQALRVARSEPAAGGESDRPAPGIAERDQESPIRGRAQALAQLRQVAAYFRRTEPHSPVAYLAEKAAHWGEMPLHQWLRAVLRDDGALGHVEELLGIARADAGEADDNR